MAHHIPISRPVLAFAALRTTAAHHPCLGISRLCSYAQPWEVKSSHGPRFGAAQRAHLAAGVFAAPQLEALSCRQTAGVCRVVPFTPGDSPFLLRQCPQESVLLPRVWPGRRLDPLCPTLPRSALSPKCGASRTGTNASSRFASAGTNGRLLSASTPSPSGSGSISGASWIARSRHLAARFRMEAGCGCERIIADAIDWP